MKRIMYTVGLLIVCCICTFAQYNNDSSDEEPAEYEYTPIVREGVEWLHFAGNEYSMPYEKYFYYRLQFKGDTVVDGKTYKKCYRYMTPTLDVKNAIVAAIAREDNKKVYVRIFFVENGLDYYPNNKDMEIYDFTPKSENDCIDNLGSYGEDRMYVNDVSYLKFNGRLHKRIIIVSTYGESSEDTNQIGTITDGLGAVYETDYSSFGMPLLFPFESFPSNGYNNKLVKVTNLESGKVEWPQTDWGLSVVIKKNKLSIYMHDGQLSVNLDCSCYDNAELVDTFGRTVKSVAVAEGETSVVIPTAGLATGVYVVSLSGASAKTSQKIFIR